MSLTVATTSGTTSSTSKLVTVLGIHKKPVVLYSGLTRSVWTASFKDDSYSPTSGYDQNLVTVKVLWGDGATTTGKAGDTFTHTYSKARKYIIRQIVQDGGITITLSTGSTRTGYMKMTTYGTLSVVVPERFQVTGTININGSPASGAVVFLRKDGRTRAAQYIASGGTYTFNNVLPLDGYTVKAYKYKTSFDPTETAPFSVNGNTSVGLVSGTTTT